ncbi:MAG: FecR domain-containing protein [Thermodesulfobacteriota bacterium]
MRRFLLATVLLAALPIVSWGASPPREDTIGIVRVSKGEASIIRGEKSFPAAVGSRIEMGDILRTGADGSVGVILRDNSSLSLGPRSDMVIGKFLFSPADGRMALFARLARGTMAYMSGLIGKLSPESVRFETPTATIGIRGTCFVVKAGDPVPN